MNPYLKSTFTKEQLALAGTIGESGDPLADKIQQLFKDLPDPLLSVSDVQELLGSDVDAAGVTEAINSLVERGEIESSDQTLRPLDDDGVTLYRSMHGPFARLKLIAIESELNDGTSRFQFTCDGRIIRAIARVDRLDALGDNGNQRQEIRKHVEQIAQGIEAGTQVPNSILLVMLDSQVTEDVNEDTPESYIILRPLTDWVSVGIPNEADSPAQQFRTVEVDFPYRRAAFDDEKSALLVDGQQRTAALSIVDVDKVPSFSLSVNGVRADSETAKRVFQVANSTVKISTEFSRALLASMTDAPVYLRKERARALAVKRLALEMNDSPFFGLCQHPGVKQTPRPPIVYNSLFQVVRAFEESALPLEEADALATTVAKVYTLVKKAWPVAWGKKPTESRLMHGVGLRAMSTVLANKIAGMVAEGNGDLNDPSIWQRLEESLDRLKTKIIWTDVEIADAPSSVRKTYVEEISTRQNTNQDIEALTKYLSKEMLSLDVDAKKAKKVAK